VIAIDVTVSGLARGTLDVAKHIRAWLFGESGVVAKNFEERGRPGWVPLAESTKRQKAALGYLPIADQTRTGKLQRDLRHPALANEDNARGESTYAVPAAQNEYAGAHEYGARAGHFRTIAQAFGNARSGLPARPGYTVPQSDVDAEAAALAQAILDAEGFGNV
jgi:phage gpG-like protein